MTSTQAALSALGTRIGFLVLPWVMLTGSAGWRDVVLVSAAQLVAYLVVRRLADGLPHLSMPADLASMLLLGAIGFWLTDPIVLIILAGVLGALRGLGDRPQESITEPSDGDTPGREGLARLVVVIVGLGVGAAAMWLGVTGALWANAMVFAVSAILSLSAKPVTPEPSDVDIVPMPSLWGDPLLRRLALTLFATNLFAQAAAVLLVVLWVREVTRTPELLGFAATAFTLGLLGGALVFGGLVSGTPRWFFLAMGTLAGGGIVYILTTERPAALLLVVAAAMVIGLAVASVAPLTGVLLSSHVPAEVRSRVDGVLSSVAYLGIPLGTAAAAWLLPVASVLVGLGIAAGALLIAMLIPVFVFHTWRQLLPEAPIVLTSMGRLPARLTVTLAYANGQWLVEVRRGRALLGSRHLVKSAEALNMLALLDVPGVHDSVEKALNVDQSEAARQAERMRNELAELEAKLAGLTEMVEITETHKPLPADGPSSPAPQQRDAEDAPAAKDAARQ